jgi:molybdopterin-guanine dinucleotide biosynthesis protein A
MTLPFTVVILAGGSARRMGGTKAFLKVGEREILERALDATGACRDLILSTGHAEGDAALYADALRRYGWAADPVDERTFHSNRDAGPDTLCASPNVSPDARRARILPDREPGLGPLAGLVWALEAAVEDRCWVLSCDLPFVTPELGGALVTELGDPGAEDSPLAAVPTVAGQLQPLCAAYRREAWRTGARVLEEGRRSMRALMDEIPVRYLSEEWLQPLGDARQLLLNVNAPEDLQTARGLAVPD